MFEEENDTSEKINSALFKSVEIPKSISGKVKTFVQPNRRFEIGTDNNRWKKTCPNV